MQLVLEFHIVPKWIHEHPLFKVDDVISLEFEEKPD